MIPSIAPLIAPAISFGLLFSSAVLSSAAQFKPDIVTGPSNNSQDLSQIGPSRFYLSSTEIQLSSPVHLAPLTYPLASLTGTYFLRFHISGLLVDVTSSNVKDLESLNSSSNIIAFINCDDLANSDQASDETIITALSYSIAILFYTTGSDHCTYYTNEIVFADTCVFTLVRPDPVQQIWNQLQSNDSSGRLVKIVPDMSSSSSNAGPTGTVDSSPSNVTTSSASPPSSSQTTAVAMIILYSITGIITALFLGIIITGAIRAHRHPERYGPRNVVGRPRQSRAKGVARAMLDTIPIVKFGDPQGPDAKGDMELAPGAEGDDADGPLAERRSTAEGTASSAEARSDEGSRRSNTITPQTAARPAGPSDIDGDVNDPGNYVCPICTDDFVKGQDVRVLPCNHQFHPGCIDPWLIDVSGTCPLCRVDLNPTRSAAAEHHHEGGDEEASSGEPGIERRSIPVSSDVPPPDVDQSHESGVPRPGGPTSGLTSAASVERLHNASVEERLATVRSLRETTRNNGDASGPDENGERRTRLAARLRERFRIRTRQHGG